MGEMDESEETVSCLLDCECVEIGQLLNNWLRRDLQMLLLEFTSLRVRVAEDEVNLKEYKCEYNSGNKHSCIP